MEYLASKKVMHGDLACRNILLAQMGDYARALKPGGMILFSGFYPVDVPHLTQATAPHRWQLELQTEKEGWSMLAFRRPA